MIFQIFFTLGKSLLMGNYFFYLRKLCSGQPQKHMLHTDNLLPFNEKLIFCQKIVNIRHNPCCRIFNRKHCIICCSVFYRFHSISPRLYMKAFYFLAEIRPHGSIAVCAFHSLKRHVCIFKRQLFHKEKIFFFLCALFCQKLILSFSADRHNLLKQLLDSQRVKFTVCPAF